MILSGAIVGISPTLMTGIADAHKPNPASPAQCSPNVDQPKTGHFASVVVSGPNATATAGVTEAGTGSNRVAFLLFDASGSLVSGPVRVHRDAQSPSSWSVSHTFTGLAPGNYVLVACFESPNDPNVPPVGVTHHVDSAKLQIVSGFACVAFANPNVSGGPDLVISQLCVVPSTIVVGTPNPSCGTGVFTNFTITIKNVGDTTASNTNHGLHGFLTLTEPFGSDPAGTTFLILESFTPTLSPGQSFSSSFVGCINVNHPILSALVDAHNEIVEVNETNNSGSITT